MTKGKQRKAAQLKRLANKRAIERTWQYQQDFYAALLREG